MNFGQAISSYFKNYAVFKGRARRSEFWYTVLFTVLVSTAVGILAPSHKETFMGITVDQESPLSQIWNLVTIVPSLAVTWRRLHDTGKSGRYFFYILIPIAGVIMLIVQLAKDSVSGANEYGEPVK